MPTALAARHLVREASPFARAAVPADGPGRLRIRIIDAGIGSSGFYSPDVLRRAAEARVFHAGLKMYLDHPGQAEAYDRPERSVRDVAGALVTDAVYDEATTGLYADVEVYSAWRKPISEMAEVIGVSIRAWCEAHEGVVEGRRMDIIDEITEAASVDYVTDAGRGGKVMEVIESARVVQRAQARGVAEATANDVRERLHDLVRQAYASDDSQYAWVRDFDASTVWFEMQGDVNGTFAQGYSVDSDGMPTGLTGERIEVRVVTTYQPINQAAAGEAAAAPTDVPVNPAGQTTTQESEEDAMPQIEEARLRQLEEDAGRVPTLTAERDAAIARAETAESTAREAVTRANSATAARIVGEAFAGIEAPTIVAALSAHPPLTESGTVDEDALRTRAEAAAAESAAAAGAGTVRGLGKGEPTGEDISTEALDEGLAKLTGRTIKEG